MSPLKSPVRPAAAGLLLAAALAAVAGCTAAPRDYALTLSSQDPKWLSPDCVRLRDAAARWEQDRKPPMAWTTGLLLGPYGLGIAAASREHQDKQRKLFARELHLACSGRPLPPALDVDPARLAARPG